MTRWIGKRGLWGLVAGTVVAAGAVAAEPGETVVFKEGNKDRKVTVTKVNKRPDGSAEVHGKDAATGEEIIWVEGGTGTAPPAPPTPPAATKAPAVPPPAATKAPAPPATKDAGLPKAKARADDPLSSAPTPMPPMPESPAEKERRLFDGKLFGRDKAATPPAPAAPPTAPQIAEAQQPPPPAKTGLLNRIFGKKTPPAPVPAAMPARPAAPPTATAPAGGEPKLATPVRPAPVTTPAPSVGAPTFRPAPAPPAAAPGIPVPQPLPATRPAAPAPVTVPTPLPAAPVPLPTIPSLPGGAQSFAPGQPAQVVLPVGYVPPQLAIDQEIAPHAAALKTATPPSARVTAARTLAGGRHGSTAQVKALLLAAAKTDPAETVRAACVDLLSRLGCHDEAFVAHLRARAAGPDGEEQDAAKLALMRLAPRR